MLEQQHAPIETRAADVIRRRLEQRFQPNLFFRLTRDQHCVLQSLLGLDLLLVVTFDDGVVERGRFFTLVGIVMHASEQVLRVNSEDRIAERHKLAERSTGGQIIFQQETRVAVQVQHLRPVLALRDRHVGQQRSHQVGGFFILLDSQQHLGLITACSIRPFQIDGQLVHGRRRSGLGSREERRHRFAESHARQRELILRRVAMLRSLVRLRDRLSQRVVPLSSVRQREVVQRQRPIGEVLHADDLIERFDRDLEILLRRLQQRQRQAVPSQRRVLLIRVRLQVLAIAFDRDSELLLVVRLVGRVDDLRRQLFRLERRVLCETGGLARSRSDQHESQQSDEKTTRGPSQSKAEHLMSPRSKLCEPTDQLRLMPRAGSMRSQDSRRQSPARIRCLMKRLGQTEMLSVNGIETQMNLGFIPLPAFLCHIGHRIGNQ